MEVRLEKFDSQMFFLSSCFVFFLSLGHRPRRSIVPSKKQSAVLQLNKCRAYWQKQFCLKDISKRLTVFLRAPFFFFFPFVDADYHPARLIMRARSTVTLDPVVSWTKSDSVIKMAKTSPSASLAVSQRRCHNVHARMLWTWSKLCNGEAEKRVMRG